MNIILNELPEDLDNKKMWIYEEEPELFSKYSQIPYNNHISHVIQENNNITEVIQVIQENKKNNDKKSNDKKEMPMELIIKHTSSCMKMRNEIYEKLVSFISQPEFSKAFGVKKSAEIIGALSNNRWNQSMALFISFLLDANVIYKEKSYLFNKDKNKIEISVM
jgi:hypothetical protein